MRYEVMLIRSEEGYAAHCPALPACWSQGCTRDEALDNIRTAIVEYLDYLSEKAADRKRELIEDSTMGSLIVRAGLTVPQFRDLL